jgi:hypothetical protein
VQVGALAGTPFVNQAPWRMVLLLIGAPGLLWALVILAIREPVRRGVDPTAVDGKAAGSRVANSSSAILGQHADSSAGPGRRPDAAPGRSDIAPGRSEIGSRTHVAAASTTAGGQTLSAGWAKVIPIYIVVAIASLVDNAVGAWAPTLLTREFHMDRAQVGMELGIMLTAAFGGGVLMGGWLADKAGICGGWSRKLLVCLVAGALILPVAASLNAGNVTLVMLSVPAYFALSGIVTACGFSAILDVVPNRSRGLAMSISFFLNVAVGGAVGPTAVAMFSEHVFGGEAGLGPAIAVTVAVSYGSAIVALIAALSRLRPRNL